jgi:hypothetical protein
LSTKIYSRLFGENKYGIVLGVDNHYLRVGKFKSPEVVDTLQQET